MRLGFSSVPFAAGMVCSACSGPSEKDVVQDAQRTAAQGNACELSFVRRRYFFQCSALRDASGLGESLHVGRSKLKGEAALI